MRSNVNNQTYGKGVFMNFVVFAIIALVVGGISGVALADEFGERFYNKAPEALGDFTAKDSEIPDVAQSDSLDDVAKDLQNIMPASGEETDTKAQKNNSEE